MSFPDELIEWDVRLARDRTRLLVRFTEPVSEETLERLTEEYDLRPEFEASEDGRRRRGQRPGDGELPHQDLTPRVNDTATSVYVRSSNEIDDDLAAEIDAESAVASVSAVFHPPDDDRRSMSRAVASDAMLLLLDEDAETGELDEELAEEFGLEPNEEFSEYLGRGRYYTLSRDGDLDDRWTAYSIRERLREADIRGVEDVVFDSRPLLSPGQLTPNDTHWNLHWHHQDANDVLKSESAWIESTGDSSVLVALVDRGVDLEHVDLVDRVAPGDDGYDPATGGDGFPVGPPGNLDDHGTAVAGVLAGTLNNGEGVSGMAGGGRITSIVSTSPLNLAGAINYAAMNGAKVINVGQGLNSDIDPTGGLIDTAIADAVTVHDAVVVAPTGNDNNDTVGGPKYPATNLNVVGVGASTKSTTAPPSAPEKRWELSPTQGSSFGDGLDVVAPGESIPTTGLNAASGSGSTGYVLTTGTSAAGAVVAGIAALVRSKYPHLSAPEVRRLIESSTDHLTGYGYMPTAGKASGDWNGQTGYGRVDAEAAVTGISVSQLATSLSFGQVVAGTTKSLDVTFAVKSYVDIELDVDGPTVTGNDGFAIPDGPFGPADPDGPRFNAVTNTVTLPATGGVMTTYTVPITYKAVNRGAMANGTVTFACTQLHDSAAGESFTDIQLSAETIRSKVAISLVLDTSGSMAATSGLPEPTRDTRMEALKYAVSTMIKLDSTDGLGMVPFDTSPGTPTPVDDGASHHIKVGDDVDLLSPLEFTAIGEGMKEGLKLLDESVYPKLADFDTKALIVFTDGRHNEGVHPSAVPIPTDVNVYAVGLGTPDAVDADVLKQIAGNTDGYALVTGRLGNGDEYTLDEYFLQILAGATTMQIVTDPVGRLRPGDEHRIPFRLTEADTRADVVLLAPRGVFEMTIETPNGDVIDPVAVSLPDTTYRVRKRATRYSFPVPVEVEGRETDPGEWNAVLRINEAAYEGYLREIEEEDGEHYEQIRRQGVMYNLSVQARSNVRLKGDLVQDTTDPGATMFLRAVVTENDRPFPGDVTVVATIDQPDGRTRRLQLDAVPDEPGAFEAELRATQLGVYHVLLRAEGETERGFPFTREQFLDGVSFVKSELSTDERRRDDLDVPDDDDNDGDDGRSPDTPDWPPWGDGGPGGVVVPPWGWGPVFTDPRLLRNPRFVKGLYEISTAMQEVERDDE